MPSHYRGIEFEVNQQLEVADPLIIFFALPKKNQIVVLPILEEERKYDFPDGDLVTSNALEVLISGYKACLNSILIHLMVRLNESGDENLEDLAGLVEQLLEATRRILEEQFATIGNATSLDASEWNSLRQLSLSFQQEVNIQLDLNTKMMKNCIEYWLHP